MNTTLEMVYAELSPGNCKKCLSTGRLGFKDGVPIPCECAWNEHRRLAEFAAKLPDEAMDPIEMIRAARALSEVKT